MLAQVLHAAIQTQGTVLHGGAALTKSGADKPFLKFAYTLNQQFMKGTKKNYYITRMDGSRVYMLHLEVSTRIFNHLITLKLLRYQIAIMNIVQEQK